jgi:hypothetical protein
MITSGLTDEVARVSSSGESGDEFRFILEKQGFRSQDDGRRPECEGHRLLLP